MLVRVVRTLVVLMKQLLVTVLSASGYLLTLEQQDFVESPYQVIDSEGSHLVVSFQEAENVFNLLS